MLVGLGLGISSLLLQARWTLITVQDWRAHWGRWVLSIAIPYIAIVVPHLVWRFVEARWRVYQELEARYRSETDSLTASLAASEQNSALLREHLSKRNWPENRPRITFDRWGQQAGPNGVLRQEAGFYLTNHGETALEITLESFTLGPDKWEGEQLSSIESKQKGFMKVERTTFVYGNMQRWNLLDGFAVAKKHEQKVRVRYRDFNNSWYRSTAVLKCAPNFGSVEVGPTTQEPLGSS